MHMATSTHGVATELFGWGQRTGSVARLHEARSPAEVAELMALSGERGLVARGLGRSSADLAQNGGGDVVALGGAMNSPAVIAIDWERRLARLSAGASLVNVTTDLLRNGWFLPVAGRTAQITVGGAVAGDLIGPNHRMSGSLSSITHSIDLVNAAGTLMRLTPHGEQSELFWATLGGLGLTGVVASIEVSVIPVTSSWMLVDSQRCDSHDDLLRTLDDVSTQYPYGWARVDTSAGGRGLGRGLVAAARHATVMDLPATRRANALEFTKPSPLRRPRRVPRGLLRQWSSRAVAEAWFRAAPVLRKGELAPLASYFHTADIGSFSNLTCEASMLHYEFAVPDHSVGLIAELIRSLQSIQAVSSQAVVIRLGPGSPSPLSFPVAGWSFSTDFPAQVPGLAKLLDDFDERLADAGGRVNLARDARLRPALVARMYPEVNRWRQTREQTGASHQFSSDASRRLGL